MSSTVPGEIAGIGSTQQTLRVSPGFDPLKSAVGPEEYFVLSRIDGKQTLREVLLTIGLPVERGVAIVTRLRSIGALLLPQESSPPASAPPAAAVKPALAPAQSPQSNPREDRATRLPSGGMPGLNRVTRPPTHDLTLPHPTRDELAALAEDVELDDTDRRRILAVQRLLPANDAHALLGIRPPAEPRDLKLAYFNLSKEIHPDRYYGKRLGTFAQRLPLVFEATSRAYARLTTAERKPQQAAARPEHRDQPQTPQAYATELFDRACQLEVGGDAMGAMKLFAAAVRVDGQLRYLRRAASCALAAEQPRSALEYAKKAHSLAPNDPSSARLLAAAFRGTGRLGDAEEVLVIAMALKSENDTLTSELRNDLADVRKLLAQ